MVAIATALTLAPAVQAAMTAEEAAHKLANPNADLAKLTFKNQFTFYQGDLPNAGDQWSYVMLFQPVFPFTLNASSEGKDLLFVRPAIPFLDAPVFDPATGDFNNKAGLGDIQYDVAFVRAHKSGWEWALGLNGTLPTATDSSLGGGQFRIGPEVFLGKGGKLDNGIGYFWGIFPSHQWDVGGWGEASFSTTKLEPFVTFILPHEWTVQLDPKISYNWSADSDDAWTVPLNLTIGKTLAIGDLPVQVQLELNYYVVTPDTYGPEWMVGLNITPVVENFIENFIKNR